MKAMHKQLWGYLLITLSLAGFTPLQAHGLFFHILAVEFYFTVEISEVRNLHFFGMDGILYLERKLTVGVRDRAGRTARNRNIDIFQALFHAGRILSRHERPQQGHAGDPPEKAVRVTVQTGRSLVPGQL